MNREIIFGSTKQRAIVKLNEIINEIIASKDEFVVQERVDEIVTNKRKITALSINETTIGYRCDKAYVDLEVTLKMLNLIVKPCLKPNGYKDGKFNIDLFGEV